MTKLQENQEYMVKNFFDKTIIESNLQNVINETFEQLNNNEIHWIHTQEDYVLNAIKLHPTVENVTILALSLSD